jgi:hypothetical protein
VLPIHAWPAAREVKGPSIIIDCREIFEVGVGGQIDCSKKEASDCFHIGSK